MNMTQSKKFTIFDWLNEITLKKRDWSEFNEEEKNEFNPYLINRFLSMNKDYIELVNYIQNIPYTEKEKYYKIYKELIPKRKVWLKYIKSQVKDPNSELTGIISKHYEFSKREARMYLEYLRKDEIQDILEKRGIDEKQIKKLLK
jgi:hypothetical protein